MDEKRKKKKKNILFNTIFAIIFLIGLAILLYPVVSNYLFYRKTTDIVSTYENEIKQISDKQKDEKIRQAQAYNQAISNFNVNDPFTKEEKEEGLKSYAHMLEVKEKIGHVEIPEIGQDLPIFAGTSESVLQKGVGHMEATSLPVGGENTHSVLTAHRGLPKAKLFTDLDKLKKGDIFLVHNLRDTLAYEVFEIQTIEPTDIKKLEIREGEDLCTLLTCTPYMVNTHRLIVTGKRVPYNKKVDQAKKNTKSQFNWKFYAIIFVAVLFVILLIRFFLKKRKKTKNRKH